jgi:hypothetical protein
MITMTGQHVLPLVLVRDVTHPGLAESAAAQGRKPRGHRDHRRRLHRGRQTLLRGHRTRCLITLPTLSIGGYRRRGVQGL